MYAFFAGLRGSFRGNDDVDDVIRALVHLLRDELDCFHESFEVDLLGGLVLRGVYTPNAIIGRGSGLANDRTAKRDKWAGAIEIDTRFTDGPFMYTR